MAPDTTLKSIEFKSIVNEDSTASFLSFVRVNLSNGMSSPIFAKDEAVHNREKVIYMTKERPIRSISAYSGKNNDLVDRLFFFDADGL